MELTSSAFQNGGKIPAKYTCDDGNGNPPLTFNNVPDSARSLVLTMEDPDVPRNIMPDGNWDHWVIFNIPSSTREVQDGQEPPGVRGSGTGGSRTYHGPCPPDREHRYYFRLYALDTILALTEGSTKQQVLTAMDKHIIAKAELVGKYARQSAS